MGDLGIFLRAFRTPSKALSRTVGEFLFVFDDGDFDEDNTFPLSDWFKHVPPEVLAPKNF